MADPLLDAILTTPSPHALRGLSHGEVRRVAHIMDTLAALHHDDSDVAGGTIRGMGTIIGWHPVEVLYLDVDEGGNPEDDTERLPDLIGWVDWDETDPVFFPCIPRGKWVEDHWEHDVREHVEACSTCKGAGTVYEEGQPGAPGSGGTITCPDCGPQPVERVESDRD